MVGYERVIDFGGEADFGGDGGIVCWEDECEFEDAASVGA